MSNSAEQIKIALRTSCPRRSPLTRLSAVVTTVRVKLSGSLSSPVSTSDISSALRNCFCELGSATQDEQPARCISSDISSAGVSSPSIYAEISPVGQAEMLVAVLEVMVVKLLQKLYGQRIFPQLAVVRLDSADYRKNDRHHGDRQNSQKSDEHEHQDHAYDGIDNCRDHPVRDHFAVSIEGRHFVFLRLPDNDRHDQAGNGNDQAGKLRQMQEHTGLPLLRRLQRHRKLILYV